MARSPSLAAFSALVLFCAGVGTSSSARADSAAVLPVRESARISDGVRADAATAAASALAEDGVRVRSAIDTEAVLVGDPLATCATVECAGAVARRVGADFVVVLSVLGTAEHPTTITVALATGDGLSFGGEAEITRARPLAQAVAAAIAEARIRQGAGTRGTLRVETTPPGATVHIDGRFRGETPLYRALEPGPHQVVVSQEGRVTETHEVVVTLHGDSALRLALATPRPPSVPRTHTERPVLGPLVLALAGTGLLAIDIVGLAQLGCTETQPGGACLREQVIDVVPFTLYAGLGAGAILGAILWFVLGAHEVVESSDATSAAWRIDLGLGELFVSGRF